MEQQNVHAIENTQERGITSDVIIHSYQSGFIISAWW